MHCSFDMKDKIKYFIIKNFDNKYKILLILYSSAFFIYREENCMMYQRDNINLTDEENKNFINCFKKGVLLQLYKDNLLTNEQLNQILKSIK